MNKTIIPAILIIIAIAGELYGDTNSLESIELSKQLTNIERLLDEYKNTNCPNCILDALIGAERVQAVDQSKSQVNSKTRNQEAEAWFHFLAKLELEMDHKFDTNEVIYLNITPPPDGEIVLPTGVNPAVIKNDKIRSEYETAIRANSNRNKNHEYQVILRRIENITRLNIEQFIKTQYLNSDRDRHELHELLTNSLLSHKDKEYFEQLLR